MQKLIKTFRRDETGGTAIEYSLIAAFIGIAIITSLQAIGIELTGIFNDVAGGLKKRAGA